MKRNLVILVIVGVLLLGLERTGLFGGLEGRLQTTFNRLQLAFYASSRQVTTSWATVLQIGNLRSRNASLEERLALLEAENGRLKKLEEENQTLKEQLGVNPEAKHDLKAAAVLGYTLATSRGFINIDQGEKDGVKKGDVVVLKDIFIGKVESLKDKSSLVKLLTDPESKVLAETEAKVKGVLIGDFGSRMRLTKVLLDEKLVAGNLVFTSGEEGLPKGMVIGKISKVKRLEAELFQEAEVEPLIDINKLEMVFVRVN